MDVVRGGELDYHAGDDIGEEDGAFGNIRAHQIQGSCEKDDIEDVVDQAWSMLRSGPLEMPMPGVRETRGRRKLRRDTEKPKGDGNIPVDGVRVCS